MNNVRRQPREDKLSKQPVKIASVGITTLGSPLSQES